MSPHLTQWLGIQRHRRVTHRQLRFSLKWTIIQAVQKLTLSQLDQCPAYNQRTYYVIAKLCIGHLVIKWAVPFLAYLSLWTSGYRGATWCNGKKGHVIFCKCAIRFSESINAILREFSWFSSTLQGKYQDKTVISNYEPFLFL